MTLKLVKSTFEIRDFQIQYTSKNFKENIQKLKNNEGAQGEVVFEIMDKAQYFQHKYFHGYLLPDIALAMGETSLDYVKQFILKTNFLYRDLPDGDWSKIPNKHRSNCRIVTRLEDGEEKIKGYVPSLSVLTYEEMRKFIKDCEDFLILEFNGCIGMAKNTKENQDEAMEYRRLAQGENIA